MIAFFVSCSRDNVATNHRDGAGAITLEMLSERNGKTLLNNFFLSDDKRFVNGWFVDMGPVAGVDEVPGIPLSGWVTDTDAKRGHGYVAWSSSGRFIGLYVEDYLYDENGDFAGVRLRYREQPVGADECPMPVTDTVDVGSGNGMCIVGMTNSSVIPFEATSSERWCEAVPISTTGRYFLTDAVEIRYRGDLAGADTCVVTLTSGARRCAEIIVKRR